SSQLVVDMRYIGQNYEIGVAVPSGANSSLPSRKDLAGLFHTAHQRSYGHHDPVAPIEIVNLRLTAVGKLPDIRPLTFSSDGEAKPRSRRPVWFSGEIAIDTAIWWRPDLAPDTAISGPAVIEQLDATTPIAPGYQARVDAGLNLIIGAAA